MMNKFNKFCRKSSLSVLVAVFLCMPMVADAGLLSDFVDSFSSSVNSAVSSAKDAADTKAVEKGQKAVEDAVKKGEKLVEDAKKGIDSLKEAVEKGFDDVPGAIDKLSELAESTLGTEDAEKVKDALNTLKEAAEAVDGLEKGDATKLVEQATKLLEDAIDKTGASDEAKKALNECTESLGKLINGEEGVTLDTLKDTLADAGKELGIDALKQGLEDVIGEENAEKVTELLENIKDGKTDAIKEAAKEELGKLLDKAGLDEDVTDSIKDAADKLLKGEDLGDTLLDCAKECGVSALTDKLKDYLGDEIGEDVGELLDKIASGEMSLDEALESELFKTIDDKLPSGSADAVKELITSVTEGESIDDILSSGKDLLQSAAKDGMASLLEKSGLDKEQQKDILAAAEKMLDGDFEGAWDSAKGGVSNFLGGLVEEKFGEEAGSKVTEALNGILNGDSNWLDSTIDAGTTILKGALENKIGEQLAKLGEKYPVLGKIFDALGINAGSIMDGISNIWNAIKDGKLGELLNNLMESLTNTLKDLAGKLKDFITGALTNLLNSLTDKLTGLIQGALDKLFSSFQASLSSFLQLFESLKDSLSNASSYFLGNESGEEGILIQMKNNVKDLINKSIFKNTESISN